MRQQNLVTCVCPTYSRPMFVEQAVRLFSRQTWRRAELLILDDSPKDLQCSVKESDSVKVVRLPERVTMSHKHNLALKLAQGDFVAHFDDDDWQSPMRLMRQLEALVLRGLDICGFPTGYLLTTGDARFWKFDRSFKSQARFVGNSVIDYGIPVMDGSTMFRRAVVGDRQYPEMVTGQKVVFLHQLWKAGAKLEVLPNDGMYVYVRHSPSSSAVNTWQYGRDRRLAPTDRPSWFPAADLEFYRRAM